MNTNDLEKDSETVGINIPQKFDAIFIDIYVVLAGGRTSFSTNTTFSPYLYFSDERTATRIGKYIQATGTDTLVKKISAIKAGGRFIFPIVYAKSDTTKRGVRLDEIGIRMLLHPDEKALLELL